MDSLMTESEYFIGTYMDSKEDFDRKVRGLQADGTIPCLSNNDTYHVYRVKKNGLAVHWSIAFTKDFNKVFTLELGVAKYECGKKAVLVSRRYSSDITLSSHEYLGEVVITAKQIFDLGWQIYQTFDNYNVFRSCQEFANQLTAKLGLRNKRKVTAGEIGAVTTLGTAVVTGLAAVVIGAVRLLAK